MWTITRSEVPQIDGSVSHRTHTGPFLVVNDKLFGTVADGPRSHRLLLSLARHRTKVHFNDCYLNS